MQTSHQLLEEHNKILKLLCFPDSTDPEAAFVFKANPEDFKVSERIKYDLAGEGDHLYIRVQKIEVDHEELLRRISKHFAIPVRDIGYAGKKDRMAITDQYLSLPASAKEQLLSWHDPQILIVEHTYHPHKLRIGHVQDNTFTIRVFCSTPFSKEQFSELQHTMTTTGFINYFGDQRFARSSAQLIRQVSQGLVKKDLRGIRDRKWAISVFQAALFNVYAHRFHNLYPSGPIYGWKSQAKDEMQRQVEEQFLSEFDLQRSDFKVFKKLALGARRPLKVTLEKCECSQQEDEIFFRFSLPSGSYASVAITQMMQQLLK